MTEGYLPFREEDAEDLYENAPCGYLSCLLDGTIVRVNRTFLGWTGFRPEDLVGRKRFQDLLTRGGRIFYETHYSPLLRMQGTIDEIAVEFSCPAGETMPALVNSTIKPGEDGSPLLIRTAVFPATDRREYERELLWARQRAEESEARSRSLAQTLQSTFIPPTPPTIPGLDVGACYRPAGTGEEVGGDFYDVFQTAKDGWAVVIGDVCGKGAEAATITALARYTVRAAATRTRRPRPILQMLNQALLQHGSDRFCTLLYAAIRVDRDGRFHMTFSSGGHPLPLHVSPAGRVRALGHAGTVLGVVEDPDLEDCSTELGPHDTLVFYTDGVTEARRGRELLGEDRLQNLLVRHRDEGAANMARSTVDEVVTFQGHQPRDDIALVVLKVPPPQRAV